MNKDSSVKTEFLREYDIAPKFFIIPGSLYIDDFSLLTEDKHKLLNKCRKYLGENYATFRINNYFADGWFYRSAVYTKMPAIFIQFDDYCEIIEFPKFINNFPLTIGLKCSTGKFYFKISNKGIEIKIKEQLHLGDWQKTEKNYPQEIDFAEKINIFKFDRWYDYVFLKITDLQSSLNISKIDILETAELAYDFINKLYNPQHRLHCEFIEPMSTKFDLHKKTYCLPTYEFARLYYLSKFDKTRALDFYCENIERLFELIYVELPEINCAVTHNTIGINDYNEIYAHTQFNTGLAGYPGGIASDLIYLLQFYIDNKVKPLTVIKEKILKLVNWLEYTQNENFIFSYSMPTVPTNEELFYKSPTGKENISVGGTAAAAYAYYLYYKFTDEKKYLDLAVKTVESVLPETDYFYFKSFGLLRDAGYSENDGVSAYYIVKILIALKNENIDYSRQLKLLSAYIYQWHYQFTAEKFAEFETLQMAVDPMTDSFSPRIGVWDLLLWSEMYLDIFSILKEKKYLELAILCFDKARLFQNKISGGIPESIGINFDFSMMPININNGVTVWLMPLADRLSKILYDCNFHILKSRPAEKNNENIIINYCVEYTAIDYKRLIKYCLRYVPLKFKSILKNTIRKIIDFKSLDAPAKNNNSNEICPNDNAVEFCAPHYSKLKSIKTVNGNFSDAELNISAGIRGIKFVAAPLIEFLDVKKIEVESVCYIGKLIKSVDIILKNYGTEKYQVHFDYGFPAAYHLKENKIYFDYTVKCRCNDNGIIKQNVKINKLKYY